METLKKTFENQKDNKKAVRWIQDRQTGTFENALSEGWRIVTIKN